MRAADEQAAGLAPAGPRCAARPQRTVASTPQGRLTALWAAEDTALGRWVAAQTAYDQAVLDRDSKIAAARAQRVRALRPYTPRSWGQLQASLARNTRRDQLSLHTRHDPLLVASVSQRVENADARLADVTARAEQRVEQARRERAAATRALYELQPDLHRLLGITKNALTRMMRP